MKIEFAKGCAWRAMYVSRNNLSDDYGRHQFFWIGIDPTAGSGPRCFGAIVNPFNRKSRGLQWRFRLPHVPWRYFNSLGVVSRVAYRISSRFWHSVDGRYQNDR